VFDYGIMNATSLANIAPQAVLLLVLAVATVMALWRNTPAGVVGAWFWMILAPSSSVVPVGTETMAEHRMYLPLAAIVVLTVLLLFRMLGLRLLPLLAVVALALGWVTTQRNRDYLSEFAIWSDTVAKSPDNARAQNNLGSLQLDRGDLGAAERSFRAALRLQSLYPSAHYNLGIVLLRTDRAAEAVDHFLTAIRLEDGFVDARVNVGVALAKLGRFPEALEQYAAALRRQPDSPDLQHNLGLALTQLLGLAATQVQQGELVAAEHSYREALRFQPGLAAAHVGLGDLLVGTSRFPEAIAEYQNALQAEPANLHARINLGNALLVTGRIDDAIAAYEQILRLRPDAPGVAENLRQAQAMKQAMRRTP
jgi:tetratricopeptide (TPR) repeat protein